MAPGTVAGIRQRFSERGLTGYVERKTPAREYQRKLDGEQEAELIRLACSEAPEGRSQWSLHLLANRMVELNVVESLSHETVRQTLTKLPPTASQPTVDDPAGQKRLLCSQNGGCFSHLSPSLRPESPVVCMDEMSRQLLGEVRKPQPVKPETPYRYDHRYQ